MSFFALLIAIGFETFLSPLVFEGLKHQARSIHEQMEVNFARLGLPALVFLQWIVPVSLWCAGFILLHGLLGSVSQGLSGLLSVGVLLYGLRFKSLAEVFTNLQLFLSQSDFHKARDVFLRWYQSDGVHSPYPHNERELMLDAISHGIERALRQYFAPIFWFLCVPGVGGVVLYWAVLYAVQRARWLHWQFGLMEVSPSLHSLWLQSRTQAIGSAEFVLYLLEWVPARLLALCIGLMSWFDEVLFAWRQAQVHTHFSNLAPLTAVCCCAVRLQADSDNQTTSPELYATAPMLFRRLLFRCVGVWLLVSLLLAVSGLLL